ncbi:MAG: hypothetical protein EBV81_07125, partial [Proteobacteria bacterium]|nr:hypothetical protein [Candidatus Fonsibacter sp. PEL5]
KKMENIQFIPVEDLDVTPVPFAALSQTQNWGMALASIQSVWTLTKGEDVVVAVLDTGIAEHDDLVSAWSKDLVFNCSGDDSWEDKASGHGTHVAGIIAGSDNDFGVVGVAPNCKVIPIKVLSNDGSGSYESIANGLRKAIDKIILEAGYIYIHYPSASKGDELALNTGAYYGKASFQATKDTSFRVYYEQDDTNGAKVTSGKILQNYAEVGFSHNIGPATLNASYGDYKKAVKHYKVGLSKEIMGYNVSADYIDNDKTKQNITDKHDNQLLVLSVSKSF